MYMDHYKHQDHPMPSVRECADRLREHANKTLTPQIQALEDELQDVSRLLAAKIRSIGYKLEALRHTELPATEAVLDDYLRDDIRKRDIEGEALAFFTRELRTKETQEEILSSLLDAAANCFPRVALFAVRGRLFRGWSSRGFSDSTARTVSSDEFSQADCSWLSDALKNVDQTESVDMPGIGSLRLMREESPGAWWLYPLHVLGRPTAILIAGQAEGSDCRPKALAILMDCVALRLENVALNIIKTLGESAPTVVNPALSVTAPSFNAAFDSQQPAEILPFTLSLNLTAPIEIPAPVKSHGESRPEPDDFQSNPLAELRLVEELPVSAMEIPAVTKPEMETIIEPALAESVSKYGSAEGKQADTTSEHGNESVHDERGCGGKASGDGDPAPKAGETNNPQISTTPPSRLAPRVWEITRILKI